MTDDVFFANNFKKMADEIALALRTSAGFFAPTFNNDDPLKTEIARFVTEGGKRLRPALSLYIARSLGHNDVQPHLALEAFHKYILAHDDIIDRDTMRYGAPTVHAKMAQYCSNPHGREHFGNSLGIVAGNLMHTAAHTLILQATVPDATKLALLQLLATANNEVTWGWYDQFLMDYLPLDSPELSLERIEKSIVWVTGKYSTKLPLLFGFAAAGQPAPKGIEALADSLGKLFQTGDDLLGLFGDKQLTGKSTSGDIIQGKKTVPMWLAYSAASEADKATLRTTIGNKNATPTQIKEVRRIVRDSGGLAQAEQKMQQYYNECLEQLAAIDLSPNIRRFLGGMVMFLQKRQK